MRHLKGTEYSASKLIRKGKPVITNLNLLLLNMAEHIKSADQNRLPRTIAPEVLSRHLLVRMEERHNPSGLLIVWQRFE
jgi:hypothetical protein